MTPESLCMTHLKENLVLFEGVKNLAKHTQNARKFGLKVIVAINRFTYAYPCEISNSVLNPTRSDTPAEPEPSRSKASAAGADGAVVSNHWALGGQGVKTLAEAVVAACESPSTFKFLYDVNLPIDEKISVIAKEIYGADGIQLSELAQKQVETYTKQGYGNLPSAWSSCLTSFGILWYRPVCMAKTQYSFSHDPKLKCVPTGKSLIDFSQSFLSLCPRLNCPHPCGSPIRRCRLSVPLSWRYANDARSVNTSRILGGRVGRRNWSGCWAFLDNWAFWSLNGGCDVINIRKWFHRDRGCTTFNLQT